MHRVLLILLLVPLAFPQTAPIQDNSFLAEEAYNQEPGVVQHISAFTHQSDGTWAYSFTQEWPVPHHPRHQLSYTVNSLDPGTGAGWGDTLLNYRYQLIGSGETRVAFSPRFSLLLPSGASTLGRGFGSSGVQVAAPLSLTLNKFIVTHWDLGVTLVPHAADTTGDRAALHSFSATQSVIWLARPRLNLLLETAYFSNEAVIAPHTTTRFSQLYLSPGVRWAYNLPRGLQIVPGIGAPIGVGPSAGQNGVLLYLSFEHPLWHETER